jgi:hypothetical protein
MTAALGDAELLWPRNLAGLISSTDLTVKDKTLLDPICCRYLMDMSSALSDEFTRLAAEVTDRLWKPPFFVVVRGLTFATMNPSPGRSTQVWAAESSRHPTPGT